MGNQDGSDQKKHSQPILIALSGFKTIYCMSKALIVYVLGVVVGIIIDNLFWYGCSKLKKGFYNENKVHNTRRSKQTALRSNI